MLELNHKEYKGLDIMKFVMAIVVVAVHTGPEISFSSYFIKQLFEFVYSIAVPFFFMASGFLLFRKISLPLNEGGEQRIKSYLKKMCRLYLVWTVIYIPLTIYGFYIDGLSPLKAIVVFFRNTLLVGENFMSWPLWYLLALIVAVSIIYILLKFKVSQTWIVIISVLMAFVGVGVNYCHDHGLLNPLVDIYFKVFKNTRNGFFVGFLFVALGLLCTKLDKISGFVLGTILIVGILGIVFNCPLSNAAVTFALFVSTVSRIGRFVSSGVSVSMRRMSTIIYFTHMLLVAPLRLFIDLKLGFFLFLIVSISMIIVALCLLLSQNKFYRILFT